MDKSPCRLFVISARDVPLAVILRRGPSKWYHLIRWHTEQDTFEQGAWFCGRIYEERCDLSPDGTLFVAMCHGGSCRPGYTYAWTAVSQSPWMYALCFGHGAALTVAAVDFSMTGVSPCTSTCPWLPIPIIHPADWRLSSGIARHTIDRRASWKVRIGRDAIIAAAWCTAKADGYFVGKTIQPARISRLPISATCVPVRSLHRIGQGVHWSGVREGIGSRKAACNEK